MAIITPALGAARSSLNRRFPNRDKASDGWIGDLAHQGTRSGHNPDETGNAEYEDSDNLDEVRAVDLDDDLRHPTLTMSDVVSAILAEPRDRDRCSYLIYNRRIWSRSAGYVPRAYTGSNPHTSHLHISGRPVNDHDDRPWLSIERLGVQQQEEDEVSWEDKLENDVYPTPATASHHRQEARHRLIITQGRTGDLMAGQARIEATLAVIAGRDPVTAVRQEFAKLTESLADGLADRLEGRVDRAIVAAALRDLLGLDDAPAQPPPV